MKFLCFYFQTDVSRAQDQRVWFGAQGNVLIPARFCVR